MDKLPNELLSMIFKYINNINSLYNIDKCTNSIYTNLMSKKVLNRKISMWLSDNIVDKFRFVDKLGININHIEEYMVKYCIYAPDVLPLNNVNIVRYLVTQGLNINILNKREVLYNAYFNGDLDLVKYLKTLDLTLEDKKYYTVIKHCSISGYINIIEYDKSSIKKLDLNEIFRNICFKGNLGMIKYYLVHFSKYILVNDSILYNICLSKKLEPVKYISDMLPNDIIKSVLIKVCGSTTFEIVQYLFDKTHSTNYNFIRLCLEFLSDNKHYHCLKFDTLTYMLNSLTTEETVQCFYNISNLCVENYMEFIGMLLHKNITINTIKNNPKFLFNVCFRAKGTDAVQSIKTLINLGLTKEDFLKINISANAFTIACLKYNKELLYCILNLGITLEDIRDNDNKALFNLCCSPGKKDDDLEMVKVFVSYGLTIEDFRSNNYRIITNLYTRKSLLMYLNTIGLTLEDIRHNNNYILQRIAYRGDLEFIKYLVSIGITLDDIRDNDNYLLRISCEYGYIDIIKYIVSLGLTLEDIRSNDNWAFCIACSSSYDLELIEYLVSLGLTLDDIRSNNNEPLCNASKEGSEKIVIYLLNLLTLEDIRNAEEALSYIFQFKMLDAIEYLVHKGMTAEEIYEYNNIYN